MSGTMVLEKIYVTDMRRHDLTDYCNYCLTIKDSVYIAGNLRQWYIVSGKLVY